MMMWHPEVLAPGWMMLWSVGMLFLMFAFWGVVIWLVYSAVRALSKKGAEHDVSPEEIARRRFASGELSAEEFEQIMSRLSR